MNDMNKTKKQLIKTNEFLRRKLGNIEKEMVDAPIETLELALGNADLSQKEYVAYMKQMKEYIENQIESASGEDN